MLRKQLGRKKHTRVKKVEKYSNKAVYCKHTGKRNKASPEKDGKTSCCTTVDEKGITYPYVRRKALYLVQEKEYTFNKLLVKDQNRCSER